MYSAVSLLVLICGLSLGLLFSSPIVILDEEIVSNPKSSAGEITIITPENITYTEPDSGYYPGTYGFENDVPGSEPMGWDVQQPDGSGFIEVDAIHAGHSFVVELRKTGGTIKAQLDKYFPDNATVGTFEYWLYKDTDSGIDPTRMGLFGDDGSLQFGIQSGDLYQGPFGGPTIASNVFSINTWHHIRVDFNIALGWQIQLDGTWYGSGYSFPFEDTPTKLNRFTMASIFSGDHSNYGAWLDALDYSWHENYAIGDNLNEGLLLSYDNTTNLEWQGYSLDGQPNKTIYGDTTIPMPVDGLHGIQVYGNDSMGAMYESDLRYFSVFTSPPEITINSPTPSQVVGTMAPSYDISITGLYDSIWYTLNGGTTNHTSSSLTGTIDQSAWSALSDGIITIDFYANNSAGMEGTAQVQVIKDSSEEPPPTPPGIPGYNIIALVGVCCIVTLIIVKKKRGRIKP